MKSTNARRSRLVLEALEDRNLLAGFQPSIAEQVFLEHLNDARANPAAYGAAIGIDLNDVSPAQPLAINAQIGQAARLHSVDMNDRAYLDTKAPGGSTPAQRIADAGFPVASATESVLGGSVYPGPDDAIRALIANSGSTTQVDRRQILALDNVFKDQRSAGVGIVNGGSGPLGNYYTLDMASSTDGRPFITGVVYSDANGNGEYDGGEGLGNVIVSVDGKLSTTTFDSGGYSIQVNPGTYSVTAAGGNLSTSLFKTITVGNTNYRLNFAQPPASVAPAANAYNLWVSQVYRDVLGRSPSAGEVGFWVKSLVTGVTLDSVADTFLGSKEYSQQLVTGWFRQYLHRDPDAEALNSFSGNLTNKVTEKTLIVAILSSPEYFQLHGGTASGFVSGVYQDLLKRSFGAGEADAWISQAATDRAGVVKGLVSSTEYNSGTVSGFYGAYLRRGADASGMSFFTASLGAGNDERIVARQFLVSQEYFNNAGSVALVSKLYRDVLGREGNGVAELGSWIAAMTNGASTSEITYSFLNSAEAQTKTLGRVYQSLLGRKADSAGLSFFLARLQGGERLAAVVTDIAASGEYFTLHGSTAEGFVGGLYQDFLGRAAASSEVAYWVDKLGQGATRVQIAAGFAGSNEYRQRVIQTAYLQYLRRSPSSTELTQGVSFLNTGNRECDFAAALLATTEYTASLLT